MADKFPQSGVVFGKRDSQETGPPAPLPEKLRANANAVVVQIHPPGADLGRRFALKNDLYIGRLTELDIPIDEDSVSRRHARITMGEGAWELEDLGSLNGSFVNDERIAARRALKDGDLLRFGSTILKYLGGSNIEAEYHEEIYRMTIMDALTGVHNKRFFLEFLDRELARSRRHQSPLALVMFDIDRFKLVNDEHGHLAGDAVLRELGRRLSARIRREDLLARYGGEEFVCVLAATPPPGAMTFADDLRVLVANTPFRHDDKAISVTISLGVSTYDGNGHMEPCELISRADENLFAAKREGRNHAVG